MIDVRTGLISREWYNFLLNLFTLVGSGQNTISLTDLQVGPISSDTGEITELTKELQGIEVGPVNVGVIERTVELIKAIQGLQVAPPPADTMLLTKAIQGLQVASPDRGLTERVAELSKAVQGLQVAPPAIPSIGPVVVTATLDFPNTLAQTSSDLTVTVPGAVDGDIVSIGVPNGSILADSCYNAWVSAADTVTVRFNNYSAGAQNPASGSFRVAVTRM